MDVDGDGSDESSPMGMCQKIMGNTRRCLSTGECRRCQYVPDTMMYEGCDLKSSTPICDATTAADPPGIQFENDDYDADLTPDCVACKKIGN